MFDFKTITAADYTVELKISPEAYRNWLMNFYQSDNMLSETFQFKIYLKQEIEIRLKMMDDLGFEEPEMEEDQKCRISSISMAYKNEFIIKMLKERGKLLRDQKYFEVIEL